MGRPIIVVLGPTASGKTKFAVELAAALNGEIISGDSRQVYRKLDIGTGKDIECYSYQGKQIPYHLIDIVNPENQFDLSKYIIAFHKAYDDIIKRKKTVIFCGGSGLYLDSVLRGFSFPFVPVNKTEREILEVKSLLELNELFLALPKTAYAAVADLSTKKRAIRAIEISNYLLLHPDSLIDRQPFSSLIFGINPSLEVRYQHIHQRLMDRMEVGMLNEAEQLLSQIGKEKLIRFGLEYKFLTRYLTGEINQEDMLLKLEIAIRQFAKRQMTYFRKMEKEGMPISWIQPDLDLNSCVTDSQQFLNNFYGM